MFCEEASNIAFFLYMEHHVYSIFKTYIVLILALFTLISHYLSKVWCKSQFFFHLLGVPQRKKCYCFFCGVSGMQQFQNVCVKATFFKNFRCSAKEPVILLFSCCILYIVFAKFIATWFQIFILICCYSRKVHVQMSFFLKFQVLHWGGSVIAYCSVRASCILLHIQNVYSQVLAFYFYLPLFT